MWFAFGEITVSYGTGKGFDVSLGPPDPVTAKLDPFRGASAPDRGFFCVAYDNPDWTSIRTTIIAVIHGVEFVYGNGWTTGDIYGPYPRRIDNAVLIWET